ncbi:hypothetical protein [Micromonospora sp. DT47]|uniref:hypothetical protein n=1 Tax=Micromonospora sp. DT47 TaxID=3393431 RepID=UPI003CF22ED2
MPMNVSRFRRRLFGQWDNQDQEPPTAVEHGFVGLAAGVVLDDEHVLRALTEAAAARQRSDAAYGRSSKCK